MTGLRDSISSIVFDLDGTLYDSPEFAATIQEAAADYIAHLRHIEGDAATALIADGRDRIARETGTVPPLSAVCSMLGGDIAGLHAHFTATLKPESYLQQDRRVVSLLEGLERSMPLYLFTNNNHTLTKRIVNHLGLNGLFRKVYAIDDTWQGKPDRGLLERIMADIGLQPAQILFVGDRYDVDLRLPEKMGCPIYLCQSVEQLLRLEKLLPN